MHIINLIYSVLQAKFIFCYLFIIIFFNAGFTISGQTVLKWNKKGDCEESSGETQCLASLKGSEFRVQGSDQNSYRVKRVQKIRNENIKKFHC